MASHHPNAACVDASREQSKQRRLLTVLSLPRRFAKNNKMKRLGPQLMTICGKPAFGGVDALGSCVLQVSVRARRAGYAVNVSHGCSTAHSLHVRQTRWLAT